VPVPDSDPGFTGMTNKLVVQWSRYDDLPNETFENLPFAVTPAKAGVQKVLKRLDSGFHRNDE
jgi:hypothetical protein